MTRSPQEVLVDHFAALQTGDPAEIVKDYSADAVAITPLGVFEGPSGVETFYTEGLKALPGVQFTLGTPVHSGEAALLQWTAESEAGRINDGVDTFVCKDGLIHIHTISFRIEPN